MKMVLPLSVCILLIIQTAASIVVRRTTNTAVQKLHAGLLLVVSSITCTKLQSQRCLFFEQNYICFNFSVKPKIEQDARYAGPQEVRAGSTLILPINFLGTPRPKVSWYRNGIPLAAVPGHVTIDTGDNYSTLTISGIEKEEGGRYEASVENIAGISRTGFDVIIKGTYILYNIFKNLYLF